jgi:hypothetical protein
VQGPNLILLSRSKPARDLLNTKFSGLCGELSNLRIIPIEIEQLATQAADSIQGVVFDVENYSPADEAIIIKLRDHGYVGGVLVLGQRAAGSGFPQTRFFDKVVFVDKPYDDKDVIGIVRRMLLAPIIAARRYPRHETNETAELHFETTHLSQVCKVKNMSKGGAYLEFGKSMAVRIGDAVTLKIKLGQLNREYALKARVAWINPRGGFGVEFVNSL